MNLRRYLVALTLLAVVSTSTCARADGPLPTFGGKDGKSLPSFGRFEDGLPRIAPKDRVYATKQFEKLDSNKDGNLSRGEVRRSGYKNIGPRWFGFDMDRNNKLSVDELSLSYAQVRLEQARKLQSKLRAQRLSAGIKVTSADKQNAAATLKSLDRNRDRKLSKTELASNWGNQASNIMAQFDLNRSKYLGSNELSMYLAAERQKRSLQVKNQYTSFGLRLHNGGPNSLHNHNLNQILVLNSGSQLLQQTQQRQSIAAQLIGRYDANRNSQLEPSERERIPGQFADADTNGDGVLQRGEIVSLLDRPQASDKYLLVGRGADWFHERDANGDGQLTVSEYAADWTDAIHAEFKKRDRNGDGVITLAESAVPDTPEGRRFSSRKAAVIDSGVGAVSTIAIDEVFVIADLDILVDITHNAPAKLEARLICPNGQEIPLFHGEGAKWSGAHFSGAVFDDQAPVSIANGQPPFQGRFKPAGKNPESAKLAACNGMSCQGNWQLLIRATRSNQPGLLNGWTMVVRPAAAGRPEAPSEQDRPDGSPRNDSPKNVSPTEDSPTEERPPRSPAEETPKDGA